MRLTFVLLAALAAVLALAPGPPAGAVRYVSYLDPARLEPSHPLAPGYPYTRYRWGPPAAPRTVFLPVVEARRDGFRAALLPALGGRLVLWAPVHDRGVFWRTRAIVPLSVGSPRGVWAPLGGVELCFGAADHADNTLSPWRCAARGPRLSARAVDLHSGVEGGWDLTLEDGGAMTVRPWVRNPNPYPVAVQCWMDFAFPVTPAARVQVAATRAVVHEPGTRLGDAGAVLPWPGGLDRPAAWPDEGGIFLAGGPRRGMERAVVALGRRGRFIRRYPADRSPGLKLWVPGPRRRVPYFELWGGATTRFARYRTLAPGATLTWREHWRMTPGDARPEAASTPIQPATRERPMIDAEAPPRGLPGLDVFADDRHRGYHALALGEWDAAARLLHAALTRRPSDAALRRALREARRQARGNEAQPAAAQWPAAGAASAAPAALPDPLGPSTPPATAAALAWLRRSLPAGPKAERAWRKFLSYPPQKLAPCGYPAVALLRRAERRWGPHPRLELLLGMAIAGQDPARATQLWERAKEGGEPVADALLNAAPAGSGASVGNSAGP